MNLLNIYTNEGNDTIMQFLGPVEFCPIFIKIDFNNKTYSMYL